MRYVSTFSGIEAASVAWSGLGWVPAAFSETDPFPCAVLRERFPEVPNLGDMRRIDWRSVADEIGRVDLVVGGSPCQSFSVAGKRAGLEGASGLMWEYVRAVGELAPRWLVWENVPGALTSARGEDFRCLLEALDALGYGLAWRVLDARRFGVPQRRERVFLVGHLGDMRAAEVLLEREGEPGDAGQGGEERGPAPSRAGGGAACAGFRWHQGASARSIGFEWETSPTLDATKPPAVLVGGRARRITPRECERLQGFPSCVELEVEKMTADELIACALANGDISCDFESGEVYGTRGPGGMKLDKPKRLGFRHPSGYIHVSLHAGGEKKQVRAHRIVYMAAYGAIPDGMVVDHINNDKSDNRLVNLQLMTPEGNSRKAAMEGRYLTGEDNPMCKVSAEVRTKMMHEYSEHGMTYRELAQKYGVSKSRVCQIAHEDDWTRVPYRGRPAERCPDGPRYKAIGNSMAVPVMRWIGVGIGAADGKEAHDVRQEA